MLKSPNLHMLRVLLNAFFQQAWYRSISFHLMTMHFNPNLRHNVDSEDSFTSCKMYAVKGLTKLKPDVQHAHGVITTSKMVRKNYL